MQPSSSGIEIPWPLFDKNQGNIRTARAQLRSVDYAQAANRRELIIALTKTYQDLVAAYEEAQSSRNRPTARC